MRPACIETDISDIRSDVELFATGLGVSSQRKLIIKKKNSLEFVSINMAYILSRKAPMHSIKLSIHKFQRYRYQNVTQLIWNITNKRNSYWCQMGSTKVTTAHVIKKKEMEIAMRMVKLKFPWVCII